MTIKLKFLLLGTTVLITSISAVLFKPELSIASEDLVTTTQSEKLQIPLQIAQIAPKEGDKVIFLSDDGNEWKGLIIEANASGTYFTIQEIGGTMYYRVPLARIVGTW